MIMFRINDLQETLVQDLLEPRNANSPGAGEKARVAGIWDLIYGLIIYENVIRSHNISSNVTFSGSGFRYLR